MSSQAMCSGFRMTFLELHVGVGGKVAAKHRAGSASRQELYCTP